MSDKKHMLRFLGVLVCATCVYAQPPQNHGDANAGAISVATERSNDGTASAGKLPPPLSIEEFVGPGAPEKLTWESLKGHVVVLEFWATWCVPCVQNIPHLNTLAEAYHDKGVRFISISDESRVIIERFLRVRPIKGWVALDPDRSMFDTFCKGISIPQTFIVDGQGVLVAGPLTPNELTKDMLGAILAGKQLPPTPSPSPEPAVSVTEPETFPPSPLDASAAFQLVIGSANGEGSYMEWSTGVYVNTSVDVETLLTRLYNLRTPLSIRWEVTPPDHPLRFVGKMPDQREELFHRIAVPALEAYLGLSITRESVQADVYVLTAPDGPGPNLTKAAKSNVTSHRFHHVSIEGLLFASDNDFGWLVQSLEKVLGRPIVEETGFQGRWNWGLEFEPGDVESLRRSAREQLGLVLTPERREIEMVVVRKAASAGEQERSK